MPEAQVCCPWKLNLLVGVGVRLVLFTGSLSPKIILSGLGSTIGTVEGLLKDQMEEENPTSFYLAVKFHVDAINKKIILKEIL